MATITTKKQNPVSFITYSCTPPKTTEKMSISNEGITVCFYGGHTQATRDQNYYSFHIKGSLIILSGFFDKNISSYAKAAYYLSIGDTQIVSFSYDSTSGITKCIIPANILNQLLNINYKDYNKYYLSIIQGSTLLYTDITLNDIITSWKEYTPTTNTEPTTKETYYIAGEEPVSVTVETSSFIIESIYSVEEITYSDSRTDPTYHKIKKYALKDKQGKVVFATSTNCAGSGNSDSVTFKIENFDSLTNSAYTLYLYPGEEYSNYSFNSSDKTTNIVKITIAKKTTPTTPSDPSAPSVNNSMYIVNNTNNLKTLKKAYVVQESGGSKSIKELGKGYVVQKENNSLKLKELF